MKFWGNVAHLKPRSTLGRYPGLVAALASSLHSDDPALQTIGLDTLAYVGVSLEGKEALAELGNIMLECVDQVGWPHYSPLIGPDDEYCGQVSCDWSAGHITLL